ncbi:MAG TPA: PaaI family thioesterase [bacterium]|nr:PaaI family thioesterase [bacterium]
MSDPHPAAKGVMSREEAERLLASCELHRALGLELLDWESGRVRFRFSPPAMARSGEGGAVHGGAIMTALDVAACFAVISAVGQDCFTVDLRVDFLRPAAGASLVAAGTVLRVGRRLGWADAVLTGPEDKLLATGRGTFTW